MFEARHARYIVLKLLERELGDREQIVLVVVPAVNATISSGAFLIPRFSVGYVDPRRWTTVGAQ